MELRHRRNVALGGALVLALSVSAAFGQTQQLLQSLAEMHDRLVRPGERLTRQAARDAADVVLGWRLDPSELEAEPARKLLALQVMFALAEGDARAARDRAAALAKAVPDSSETLELSYLAALVAADGKAASEALQALSRRADASRRSELSQKRRRVRGVGKPAPDIEIRTDGGDDFAVRRRGDDVLVVDFWSLRSAPSKELCRALRAAYDEFRDERHLQFVGVNADPEDDLEASHRFAAEHRFEWPQCYEGVGRGAPITHKAFRAGNPPWTVIVDSYGTVRFIGGADEPAFYYVLAAVLAEADGRYDPPYRVGASRGGEHGSGAEPPVGKPPPPGASAQPKSNPDALNLFNQARLALRTGSKQRAKKLFQEVIRRWPDSLEAKKAAEILETL